MEWKQLITHISRPPRTFRNLIASPASLFLLMLLLLTVGYKTAHIMVRERALERDVRATEERMRAATKDIGELKAAIAHSQDAEVIERIAKEQLNLQKPGEEVAVVVPTAEETNRLLPKVSFWKSFLNFLLKNR